METSNLPHQEFKVMIRKMFSRLERGGIEFTKDFNKKTKNIKKIQFELKSSITEMKNTLEGLNRRLDDIEQISNLENRLVEVIQAEQQ